MKHEEFAEQVARKLEDTAEAVEEDKLPIGGVITAMRANELRVAACMVRDLSHVATRKEEKGSLEEHLPPELPSKEYPLSASKASFIASAAG